MTARPHLWIELPGKSWSVLLKRDKDGHAYAQLFGRRPGEVLPSLRSAALRFDTVLCRFPGVNHGRILAIDEHNVTARASVTLDMAADAIAARLHELRLAGDLDAIP